FKEAAERCHAALEPGWSSSHHSDEFINSLERHAFPFPFSLEGATIQTIQTPHVRDASPIQDPDSIPRNRLSSCRWFARHDRRLRWGGRRTAQRDRRKRDQTSTADHFRVPAERGGRRAVPLGLIGLILG